MTELLDELFERIIRRDELIGARTFGAVLCRQGAHDEMVPGGLPCPSCGAAL